MIWLLKPFFNKRGVTGPFFDGEDVEINEEMATSDSRGVVCTACVHAGVCVDGWKVTED